LNTREGLEKRKLRLGWTERLVDHLVEVGFSSRFGARPLQRAIEQEIVTQLAFYLNRKSQLRDSQLTVDFDPDQHAITISEGAANA
jgi:ATP-dependent Clp protease ATP-binding subunit ClpC